MERVCVCVCVSAGAGTGEEGGAVSDAHDGQESGLCRAISHLT